MISNEPLGQATGISVSYGKAMKPEDSSDLASPIMHRTSLTTLSPGTSVSNLAGDNGGEFSIALVLG